MLPSSVSASAPEDGSTSFYDATEAGSSRQGPFTYSASYYGERDGQLGVLSKRRVMPTRYHALSLAYREAPHYSIATLQGSPVADVGIVCVVCPQVWFVDGVQCCARCLFPLSPPAP